MYKYQISFAFEYNGIRQARIVVLMFQNRFKAAKFAQKQCDRMNEYGKNKKAEKLYFHGFRN